MFTIDVNHLRNREKAPAVLTAMDVLSRPRMNAVDRVAFGMAEDVFDKELLEFDPDFALPDRIPRRTLPSLPVLINLYFKRTMHLVRPVMDTDVFPTVADFVKSIEDPACWENGETVAATVRIASTVRHMLSGQTATVVLLNTSPAEKPPVIPTRFYTHPQSCMLRPSAPFVPTWFSNRSIAVVPFVKAAEDDSDSTSTSPRTVPVDDREAKELRTEFGERASCVNEEGVQ